jgi:hypothetical protein
MIKCNLTIKDWFTAKVTKKVIMPKDPEVAARIHSKNNPNASVIVEWANPRSMRLALLPYNMELDQELVDEQEMDVDYFTSKWYGKVSKAKMQKLQEEIESEFVTSEIEN